MEHGRNFLRGGGRLLSHLGGDSDQNGEQFSNDSRKDIVRLTEPER